MQPVRARTPSPVSIDYEEDEPLEASRRSGEHKMSEPDTAASSGSELDSLLSLAQEIVASHPHHSRPPAPPPPSPLPPPPSSPPPALPSPPAPPPPANDSALQTFCIFKAPEPLADETRRGGGGGGGKNCGWEASASDELELRCLLDQSTEVGPSASHLRLRCFVAGTSPRPRSEGGPGPPSDCRPPEQQQQHFLQGLLPSATAVSDMYRAAESIWEAELSALSHSDDYYPALEPAACEDLGLGRLTIAFSESPPLSPLHSQLQFGRPAQPQAQQAESRGSVPAAAALGSSFWPGSGSGPGPSPSPSPSLGPSQASYICTGPGSGSSPCAWHETSLGPSPSLGTGSRQSFSLGTGPSLGTGTESGPDDPSLGTGTGPDDPRLGTGPSLWTGTGPDNPSLGTGPSLWTGTGPDDPSLGTRPSLWTGTGPDDPSLGTGPSLGTVHSPSPSLESSHSPRRAPSPSLSQGPGSGSRHSRGSAPSPSQSPSASHGARSSRLYAVDRQFSHSTSSSYNPSLNAEMEDHQRIFNTEDPYPLGKQPVGFLRDQLLHHGILRDSASSSGTAAQGQGRSWLAEVDTEPLVPLNRTRRTPPLKDMESFHPKEGKKG